MPAHSVADHYAELLGPVYLWMAGGLETALAQGESDLAPFVAGGRGLAVDLGAGFGMHTIALARSGWQVIAIDTSQVLLEQLAAFGAGLPIEAVCADLRHFTHHLAGRSPDLVLCMGDTLTHLAALSDVESLLHAVAASLAPGGRFVATFRDHRQTLEGAARFVPVRSDAERLLTCFIEAAGDRILVHDVLHERRDGTWTMRVSAYPKLRLAPEFVGDTLTRAGLAATVEPGPRGMMQVHARAG